MGTCNHRYIGNYARLPRGMGERCVHPELFEARGARALPIDDGGLCIFHSRQLDWKKANDFEALFLDLVDVLGVDYYDFAEFVFMECCIAGATFRKYAYFTAASFLGSFALDHVDFQGGAAFGHATFAGDLKMHDTSIRGVNFGGATMAKLASFSRVRFLDHALFDDVSFSGSASGSVVKFEECCFEGITDFSGAAFLLGEESSVTFSRTQFEDFANFQNTRFRCQVVFDEVRFGNVTEFIDTSFESVGSSARFRGAAVELNQIEVPAGAVLTFKSTSQRNKMFTHDVQISFKEDPAGIIRFDNVDFSKIGGPSRLRLMRLSKTGSVEIGAGCIKYRHQTPLRTIAVSENNLPLVFELCHTFSNYFTQSNGLNLGFEIVERDQAKVSFFYFTDEDISEETFLDRLAQTERRLWNLLSVRSDRQLLLLEEAAGAQPVRQESAVINAVDGISALLGTFFRVGARIALGVWKAADTHALLSAIRFNDAGADDRAASLHRVIVDKYTGKTLLGINSRQNELLLPMLESAEASPSGKVRILFLGANSLDDPLQLDKEVQKIKLNLRLARERDHLELQQESAVTVDTLTQAMLDAAPTIVHFAGHGLESGIILQDELGKPRVVSAEALARLFQLFKDTVRCVVLSSCYSELQARAIRLHVPHVIGMSAAIPDDAAIAFATGFYQAIGAGREIPFAFALGVAKIELDGVPGEDIPILL